MKDPMIQSQEELQHQSAEWCEHDDRHLTTVIDGKHANLDFRLAGLTLKENLVEYLHRWGGVASMVAADTAQIVGPAFKWKLVRAESHQGFVPADMDWGRERQPGETVRLKFVAA